MTHPCMLEVCEHTLQSIEHDWGSRESILQHESDFVHKCREDGIVALSIFNGIGMALVALRNLGIRIKLYLYVDISTEANRIQASRTYGLQVTIATL